MTERLDRIEAILQSTAEQQAKNTDEIDTLIGVAATNEASIQRLTDSVQELVSKVDESNKRFNVLRLEAAEDRQETRRLFNDVIAHVEQQQRQWQARFDSQQSVIERLLLSLLDRSDAQERLQARVTLLERPREAS